MSDLLTNLNEEQKNAVTHTTGPLLIVAGAGTGKTKVITTKIAWLIQEKLAKPEEILALTFTDKAAGEMEERADALLPYGVFDHWISTFHSFCDRVLQSHCLDIGLSPDFKLLNATEGWLFIRKHLYTFALDYYRPKGNPSKFIHALIRLFSRLKDENITPEEYLAYAENIVSKHDAIMGDEALALESKRIKETAEAYYQYQQLLLDNGFLDFSDLIFYVNKLFVQRPNILAAFQNQFKYILIDEFQDTNLAQYQLIKLLTLKNTGLTVVGDDDQSIYKFRGASVSNILHFKRDFPSAREVILTKNYRSGQYILDTAYEFIQHNNPDRLEYQLNHPDKYYQKNIAQMEPINKKLLATVTDKGSVQLLESTDEQDEVNRVITMIKKIVQEENASYNDIAILVRANKSAEPFIKGLEQEQIPFIYLTNTGLYTHEMSIDLLTYTRILFDRSDSVSLYRALQIPPLKIPNEDLLAIINYARRKAEPLFLVLEHARKVTGLKEETSNKIDHFVTLIKQHAAEAKTKRAHEMILTIINDLGYREYLVECEKINPNELMERVQDINQLRKKIEEYVRIYKDASLEGFLKHTELEREAGDSGAISQDTEMEGPDAVRVLTIHASKGLEFTYVFVVQMADQRFPTIKRSDPIEFPTDLLKNKEILPEGDEHKEEERRLFYVALTRAKKWVFLSFAKQYGGRRTKKPSKFLIEANLLKKEESVPGKTQQPSWELPPLTREKFSTVISLPQKTDFSYSQIEAFKKCPLQYKYQFILQIPQDKGRAAFSFGRTIHNTLLGSFRLIIMRAAGEQQSLFGKSASAREQSLITMDELSSLYEKNWIDEWYDSPEQKMDYHKRGKQIIKEFYERHKNLWPIPFHLEHPFRMKIGPYTMKGRIDRIDKITDNTGKSGLEIIDYKTSPYREKLETDDKMQLLIYQMALESGGEGDNRLKPVKLTYYYLHEDRQDTTSFLGTADNLEKTKTELIQRIEAIRASDFHATPSQFTCSYCDFRNICPFSAV